MRHASTPKNKQGDSIAQGDWKNSSAPPHIMPVAVHSAVSQASQEQIEGFAHGEDSPLLGSVHGDSPAHGTIHGEDQGDQASPRAVHSSSVHSSVHDESASPSKDTSDASDPKDSSDYPFDHSSATPAEDSPLSPALSSWQDIVSVMKLKFGGEMLPLSPRKHTCRVRDDSGFHQEEEDPVFHLPLFPTL